VKTAVTLNDAPQLTKGDIFDLEHAYVEDVRAQPRDNRQGVFHPSTVGMCGRRNVYEYIRTPALPTIEPEDLEVFDIGHAVHELVQEKLKKLDRSLNPQGIQYRFQKEAPYDPATDKLLTNFGIAGTCDGIVEIWTDTWRQRGVVEIKSIKDENYKRLSGPKEDHILQAHLYAYRFDCPIIWMWYYNKNTSTRRVYPVVFQQELLMTALQRFQGWLQHADAGTLPEREENWYACPRCEYRDVCDPPTLQKIRKKDYNTKVSRGRRAGKLHRM